MEDLDSFWTFQESIAVDELKQKLQYTTYELELTRKETDEEIRKSNEHIKQLLQVLQTTCKERDEAKAQLKKFQQIMSFKMPNNIVNDNHIVSTTAFPAAPFSPDSPLLTNNNFPTKTNSSTPRPPVTRTWGVEMGQSLGDGGSITESSSFSLETHTNNTNNNVNNNPQSHVSSPVVDSVSSADSASNIVNFSTPVAAKPATVTPPTKVVDQESLIIANFAKGRPLPTKGQLLQAVIEAGPLLSTLMVAGSLPQWRNPPGVLTHQIPPVNLKGCVGSGSGLGLGAGPGAGVMSHNKQNVMPVADVSTSAMYNGHVSNTTSSGSIGICPSSMLDFGSGSCFMGGRMMMNSGVSFDCQIPKRQRII